MCVPPRWDDEALTALGVNGFGGAADPRVITALAGDGGRIDSLDLVVAARGRPGPQRLLVPRPDLDRHPRAQLAASWRDELQVLGLADSADVIVTCGRGLGGLAEIGFELAPEVRGGGLIGAVLEATTHLVCPGEVLLASASPGNVASVRALLAVGFAPIGSVQLFSPRGVDA
ncbi:RimJ/RimL family protein N-acetyltransferase [Rudaeicoccus suwonensis]|uniref:RimJ/RimL family protein N-acetyltransferase n=2 Tax=Rudaeicoccus suwonensis TaxID=657409 RepID=A0A561EB35_9MICO|nr:RimJ/RimL family protein N-acetyltransferase [Rudaeicoccus suwonensis]